MPARIASFLRNTAPNAYCNTCLSTSLKIDKAIVARETQLLGQSGEFKRARRVCSYCGSVQVVIALASTL
jgi:hypothetical protein